MTLRAGGAPALLRRDLGTPGAIAGARAVGGPLYGARLTTARPGTVLMRAGDGAAQASLTAGGAAAVAASVLPALGQTAQAAATVPAYGGAAASVLPGVAQAAAATATAPGAAAVAASVLPGLAQGAQGAATVPALGGGAASILPGLVQAAGAVATAPAYAATAATTLPGLSQAAQAAATVPAYAGAAASMLPALGQAAQATWTVLSVILARLRLTKLTRPRLRLVPLLRSQMTFDGRPVRRMEEVMQGEAVLIELRFTDAAGVPVAVGGAALRAQPPAGASRTYSLAAGAGVGEWAGTVLFDQPGRWWLEGDCLTPSPAVTPSLLVTVRARAVPAL